jgi:plasmid stability protein
MGRTTLVLPEPLHQKLRLTAQSEGTSLTKLVRELLAQSLARRENGQLQALYQGLKELEGAGKRGISDASTTIDEMLYGQKGVWRGDE